MWCPNLIAILDHTRKKQDQRLFLVYNADTKIDIQLFFCLNDHHITFFG